METLYKTAKPQELERAEYYQIRLVHELLQGQTVGGMTTGRNVRCTTLLRSTRRKVSLHTKKPSKGTTSIFITALPKALCTRSPSTR